MACEGCKQNKLIFERRGFLAGIAFFASRAPLFKAQKARTAASVEGINVLRLLNTLHAWRHSEENNYTDHVTLLRSKYVAQALDTNKARKLGITEDWVAKFNLTGDEILPGWRIVHTLKDGGYSIELTSDDAFSPNFSTGDSAIIVTHNPPMFRSSMDRIYSMLLYRCVGPLGYPLCCCRDYPCCDGCYCCNPNRPFQCFNCGCPCCLWCENGC